MDKKQGGDILSLLAFLLRFCYNDSTINSYFMELERMEKVYIIKDDTLGMLSGRDCIYINSVTQNDVGELILKGEINGNLADKIKLTKWIPFNLAFHNIIAYFSCEIDTYFNICFDKNIINSDFNLLENSEWLKTLPIRKDFDKSKYKHYQVYTYDCVFNIIAESYEINCDLVNAISMN